MQTNSMEIGITKITTVEKEDKTEKKVNLEGDLFFKKSDGSLDDTLTVKMTIQGEDRTVSRILDGYDIGCVFGGSLKDITQKLETFGDPQKTIDQQIHEDVEEIFKGKTQDWSDEPKLQ